MHGLPMILEFGENCMNVRVIASGLRAGYTAVLRKIP